MQSKPGKGGYCLTDVPLGFLVFFCVVFSCWKGIQELLISLDMLLFFPPEKKPANPYVATTKRIVYAFLSECQEKKNQKTKTKPFLNLLL